jgi:hypothetical protein
MGAIAQKNANLVRQTVVSLGDGTYAVRLGGTADGTTGTYYRVDADLPTFVARAEIPYYARLGLENSLWVAIIEKAYVHYRAVGDTYDSLATGSSYYALRGLNATGVDWALPRSYGDAQAMMDDVGHRFDSGLAVVVGTMDTLPAGSSLDPDHAYTVVGVHWAGGHVTSITVRNPWGPAGAADAFLTLTGDELLVASDGIIWADVG